MGHHHVWTAPGPVIWVPIRLAFPMHADKPDASCLYRKLAPSGV